MNGVLHTYTLDGTKILRETWGSNTLIPLYDNEDSVCGIIYNNVPYYFIKNLQGDVIAIVDKEAKTVARYSYDAWGAVTSSVTYSELTNNIDIATINPFRYRGYYYDEAVGLYYLQSRYYDPTIGRFINGDDTDVLCFDTDILEEDLYSYCHNSPINSSDPSGYSFKNNLLSVLKSLGLKAFKILRQATSLFLKNIRSGKIPCAGLAIIIDFCVSLIIPHLPQTMKKIAKILLGYKSINSGIVNAVMGRMKSSLGVILTKFGCTVTLNVIFSTIVNNCFMTNVSRFLTIGGIVCFLLDCWDGKIDMWVNFPKIGKKVFG